MKIELSKLESFLQELQRSWEAAKKSIEIAKEAIKIQFDKKRRNLQGLKTGKNVWLEAKNINLNWSSKKLDQKRYGPFKISKNIGQGVFQLELLEEWMIHNMFNKDLLKRYRESQFKEQYIDIVNKKEEYKVEEVRNYRKQGCSIQFLIYWKGYGNEHD